MKFLPLALALLSATAAAQDEDLIRELNTETQQTTAAPTAATTDKTDPPSSNTVKGIQVTPGVAYVHAVDPVDDTNRSAIYLGSAPTFVIACADGDKRRIWSYLEGTGTGQAQSAMLRIGMAAPNTISAERLKTLSGGATAFDQSATRAIVSALIAGRSVSLRVENGQRTTVTINSAKFLTAWKKIGACQSHPSQK